jgi:translation initiation factor IF-3
MKDNRKPLNDEIKASRVKLVSSESELLGEMSLSEAKQKAKENDMDLVQI